MILNRLGNKSKIALKVQSYFPKHTIYMEPFFGAGGMYFNKPKARYNYLNDKDNEVYNVFRQLMDNKEELTRLLELTPIVEKQFKEWAKGKREDDEVMNAVRFLHLSNFGLYGKSSTLRIGAVNPRAQILKRIESTFEMMNDTFFFNVDFRDFFKKLDYKSDKSNCFCYCDPPYLDTTDNYSDSFVEKDAEDLFELMSKSGVKFAISEFDHPKIIELAEKHKFNLLTIGERKNVKNRRVEVLVTNYATNQISLF